VPRGVSSHEKIRVLALGASPARQEKGGRRGVAPKRAGGKRGEIFLKGVLREIVDGTFEG